MQRRVNDFFSLSTCSMSVFNKSFKGFGTDTLPGLLLQLIDDFLEVFGGILKILLDFVLLVEAECRSTSSTSLVI